MNISIERAIGANMKRRLRLTFMRFAVFAVVLLSCGRAICACPIESDAFISNSSEILSASLQSLNLKMQELYQKFYCLDHRLYFEHANFEMSQTEKSLAIFEIRMLQDFRNKHHIGEYKSETRDSGGDLRRQNSFLQSYENYIQQNSLPVANTKLADYEIVLVAGFGNESFRAEYFSDMRFVLINVFGLPGNQIHLIYTDTYAEAGVSVKLLITQYQQIKITNPQHKIIFVGHSRGGLVIVNSLIEHPEILEDHMLQAAVTIQSPLKGTPTAELLEKQLSKLSVAFQFFCKSCAPKMLNQVAAGAKSMEKNETHQVVKTVEHLSEKQLSLLSKKLFYISAHSSHQSTKLGAHIIKESNDGTVPFSSQYIRSFGRKLALLPEVGHTDLVISGSKSGLTELARRSFAVVLFEQLLKPETYFEDGMD